MQHPVRVDKRKRKRSPVGSSKRSYPGQHDPHGSDKVGAPEVVGRYPVERKGGGSSNRPRTWPHYSDQGYPEPETALEVPVVIKKRRKGKRKPG